MTNRVHFNDESVNPFITTDLGANQKVFSGASESSRESK